MTYKPHPDFSTLYDLYTGPNSIAAALSHHKADATAGDPLLVSTGSDLVLFPGNGRPPIVESFRLSTRGFRELTAISHLGTALAWMAEMQEAGLDEWKAWAERFIAQCVTVRQTSTIDYWCSTVDVAAWEGFEAKIVDLVDYACVAAQRCLEDCLNEPALMTHANVRESFLEAQPSAALQIPFNDVMIATFSLTFLDIACRTLTWLQRLDLDWSRAMVMICGSSGRPTAGLTWATNNMCQIIWRASQRQLQPDRLLIAPHAAGLDLAMFSDSARVAALEASYRGLWCKTRVTAEIGGKMFEGFPEFKPDISSSTTIDDNTKSIAEMPRLRHADDRLTAIARLRMVMEDPRQLLSNSVSEYIIDALCDNALDPAKVIVPGFTNNNYPEKKPCPE